MKQIIEINDDVKFEFDLKVTDCFGKTVEAELAEEECGENKYVFVNKNNIFEFETALELVRGENYAYLDVDCDLKTRSSYDRRHILNAYDTVTVTLRPLFETDKVFGSCFYEGEKCDCWATDFHCKGLNEIPERLASMVWQYNDTYYHMLPLCDGAYKSEIKNIDGALCITTAPYCGGYSSVKGKSVVISWGCDPYKTAENTVDKGFEVLGLRNASEKNTRCSEVFDYLGWCSWDSLGRNVNSDGIYEKLEEFKEKNIPVRWVLLDDGWYPENELRMAEDFREVPEKFPEGLKGFVDKMKNEYGMKYAGIWECYAGGWRGIDPDCRIAKEMRDIVVTLPNKIVFPRTDEEGSFAYWNVRHDYLSKCGFDFVKVDVECNIETCTHGYKAIGDTARGAHYGMEGSLGLYFDGACINCTGMGHESLWNRPVGMVNRNSADFLPNRVKTMNKFVNDNIYNSFYHSYFSTTDWDMMWSGGSDTAKMNTVLHAISGGPVYLSDPLGLSKPEVIMPFCLSDGRVLKCDRFAQPTEDRLFRNPRMEDIAAKAWNMSGKCGIIGVFNTNENEKVISDSFKISDVKYIDGEKFLLYNRKENSISLSGREDIHEFKLEPYDAALYVAAPFENGIAVLGNLDKYISPACIETKISDGDTLTVILREGGQFAFAAERNAEVCVNGRSAEVEDCGIYKLVDCSSCKGKTVVQIFLKQYFEKKEV